MPPAAQVLESFNLPYRVFRHPGPVHSLEQAARERGHLPEQVVRSILFRVAEGEYVMALMAGDRQVNWKTLRRCLGVSRVTMASEEEVKAVTGSLPGAVSPFGLPQPLRLLVDPGVLVPAEISIGSGERGVTIILSQDAFRQGLDQLYQSGRLAGDAYEVVELA